MPSRPRAPDEPYELLKAFRELFEDRLYNHRKSTLGDYVASRFYEDLLSTDKSPKLVERINAGERVVNAKNVMTGKKARRGDGTFGELVPVAGPVTLPDAKSP